MDDHGDSSSSSRPAWAKRSDCEATLRAFWLGETAALFVYRGVLADIEKDRVEGRPRLLRWAGTLSAPVPPAGAALDAWLGLCPALGEGDVHDLERLGWMLATWYSGRDVVLRVAGRRLHHQRPSTAGAKGALSRCLAGYLYEGIIGTIDEVERHEMMNSGGGVKNRDRELARHALTLAQRAAAGEWRLGVVGVLATGPAARLANAPEQAVIRERAILQRRRGGRE